MSPPGCPDCASGFKCEPCREYDAAKSRRYYHANKDKARTTNRKVQLRIRYGLTPEDYDRMSEKQGGLCAICHGPPCRGRKFLDVDHDHLTNVVRGLLCSNCNRAVGLFGDDSIVLARAVEYLTSLPGTTHRGSSTDEGRNT